ncbi:hypothetical protein [Thalassomonas haliotis]|uniref:Uncharacterized protein n=1 Tax=Thalassomonas haliotis TaxID=485448 RepID=A0ABY7VEZ9_9GAMM|nr:hypothetical protein [Thalassomonas haliotis]WDE12030.1 hypothetical protein H3N35_00620 [Thalassomonas haliotis]
MNNKSKLIIDLRLKLNIYGEQFVYPDFQRFRYKGVPKVYKMLRGTLLERDEQVIKWYRAFKGNTEYTDTTLHSLYRVFTKYVKICDSIPVNPDSKKGISAFETALVHNVRTGAKSSNSAKGELSNLRTIMRMLDHPVDDWFSKFKLFRSQITPTQAYSEKELKTLIKILQSLYFQLSKQIQQSPQKYIQAGRRDRYASFSFNEIEVQVNGAITKCYCSAYFLLAYYTWGNAGTLRDMGIPKASQKKGKEGKWFVQTVLKKRANKYVTIELGDNLSTDIPKHALNFINDLLTLTHSLFPTTSRLLHQCIDGINKPLCPNHIRSNMNWLISTFDLTDDNGQELRPEAKRFRATGSANYLALTGNSLETSQLLNNTPVVVQRHYSKGNESENNAQLQATANTLENAIKCGDIDRAREQTLEQMNLEVLPYEEFVNRYAKPGNGQKTPLGTGCKDPFDKHGDRFRRKASIDSVDMSHLACADLLNCFSCPNQVLVEEVDDIWCLMSFYEALKDAREDHLNMAHFKTNFERVLNKIKQVLFSIDLKVRRQAEKKLLSEGRHPFWPNTINLVL